MNKEVFHLEEGEKTDKNKLGQTAEHKKFLSRISEEFREAYDETTPLFDEWLIRTKLLNNQKKDKNSVGVPLLYTTMNTVVSALYDDKLGVTHIPYSSAGIGRAEVLDKLALNDYRVMKKAITDYFWIHDAGFYGFSPLLMQGWNEKKQVPEVELMDPMTFFYDPRACFVDDFMGKAGLRYFGRQRLKGLDYIKNSNRHFNTDSDAVMPGRGNTDRVERTIQVRSESKGEVSNLQKGLRGNPKDGVLVTEWWTFDDEGKRVYVEVAGDLTKGMSESCIIRYEVLEFQDAWPLINRVLIPRGDSFRGLSIPDLIEDKQRYMAKFLNLNLKSAEFATYGQYLLDTKRISMDEIGTPAPNKFIPVNGDPTGAMQSVPREGMRGDGQWVLQYMESVAQQSTATPSIIQGQTPDKSRSATEIATQSTGIDRRYTLSAKILGWSEQAYYEQWYRCYETFFPKSGEKVIRLMGELGTLFSSAKKNDFIDEQQPEVYIQSSVMGEIERTTKLQSLTNVMQVIASDPNVNRRYLNRKTLELSDMTGEEITLLLPATPEELHARGENEAILDEKTPQVSIRDDHMAHLEIHNQLPQSKRRDAHIEAHKNMMMIARQNPELLPAPSQVNPGNAQEQNPEMMGTGGNQQANPTNLSFKSPIQRASL